MAEVFANISFRCREKSWRLEDMADGCRYAVVACDTRRHIASKEVRACILKWEREGECASDSKFFLW